MILTILSTLLASVSSILPAVVSLLQKKNDQAHEIEMAKMDMQKIELQSKLQIDVANVNADIGEGKSLYDHDGSIDGDGFWNNFRASVRPVLTYLFFALFVLVKVSALVVLLKAGLNVADAMPILWDDNTNAIFGAIMGFWFGSRALERFGFGARNKK